MILLQARPHFWREVWKFRTSYLFIAPFYIWFGVFGLYPLIYTLALSLYQWDGGRDPWFFVGLANYASILLDDQAFRLSLVNTAIYLIILLPLLLVVSLVIATILSARNLRGRGIFRTAIFLPYVTSGLIMGLVFLSLLDDNYGWLNDGLHALHLGAVPWLRSTTDSKFGVILVMFWRNVGYYSIIAAAGLLSIEREFYEAASIDGANAWQSFCYVTVPLMRPILLFITIIVTIMVLNMFEVVFALTQGGPEYSSQTLMLTLYQRAFQSAQYGAGSAMAVAISLITIVIAAAQIKVIRFE